MIEHSDNIATLACALLGAQSEMGGAKRDAKNPHFKSTYATLETVIETAKPALQAYGIAFMQAPGQLVDGALEVTTMLVHGESGQWMRSTLHVPLQKRDPQGVGSAITYACRYSLMAMLGIPPVDDDGESAMDRSGGKDTLSKADARPIYTKLVEDMRRQTSKSDLRSWISDPDVKAMRAQLPADWDAKLRQEAADHGNSLDAASDFPGDPNYADNDLTKLRMAG